ncbi:MAG: orotidine-5'-phosphate decarboxylase [Phycisphaeraceae bacterium]
MPHFADQLFEAIAAKDAAPVCVGIDPVFERLPAGLQQEREDSPAGRVDAVFEFVMELLEIVAPLVPCVKLQSACFERYGPDGVQAYYSLTEAAVSRDLIVIGDAKRGDIGTTAAHYAVATLTDPGPYNDPDMPDDDDADDLVSPDAVTVNPYFGDDGLRPFLEVALQEEKGVFALVRTSNPGGDAIQALMLNDGRTVAEAVAELVADLGSDSRYLGQSGYSLLGAVVGATKPDDAARLRKIMPRQIFLVPGFGAQGGSIEDIRPCFNADKRGALITASRSITYAFAQQPDTDWRDAVAAATRDMKKQVTSIF